MANSDENTIFDPLDLRRAFGVFATGITIVTTTDATGKVYGFTANSFTSLSIDPPLLLVSIAKSSYGMTVYSASQGFAVNILAEKQRELSNRFATQGIDKYAGVSWHTAKTGSPIFDKVAAWFDCENYQQVDAGDHLILIGKVLEYSYNADSPLGFCRGAYVTYGLTPQMLELVSSSGQLRVGALIENDGRILLQKDIGSGEVRIPIADTVGNIDEPDSLIGMLTRAGIEADLSFLFSAYHVSNTRFIYYRGELQSIRDLKETASLHFVKFAAIPWSSIHDYAVRRILRRYESERSIGSYSVFIGGQDVGDVYPDDIQDQ